MDRAGFIFLRRCDVSAHNSKQLSKQMFANRKYHLFHTHVTFQLWVNLIQNNIKIIYRKFPFNRVLNSGIISSTILFNNGSKFENLSEPVVINLSSVMKVRFFFIYQILNQYYPIIIYIIFWSIKSTARIFLLIVISCMHCPCNQSQNMRRENEKIDVRIADVFLLILRYPSITLHANIQHKYYIYDRILFPYLTTYVHDCLFLVVYFVYFCCCFVP